MKRLLFKMTIVGTVIISLLSSCSKDDSLPDRTTGGASMLPMTLNLTASNWQEKAGGVFVNIFSNAFASVHVNYSLKVYLVTDGKDIMINQPISFMNGQLWATNTGTDLVINYRGNYQHIPYLNIKAVLDTP